MDVTDLKHVLPIWFRCHQRHVGVNSFHISVVALRTRRCQAVRPVNSSWAYYTLLLHHRCIRIVPADAWSRSDGESEAGLTVPPSEYKTKPATKMSPATHVVPFVFHTFRRRSSTSHPPVALLVLVHQPALTVWVVVALNAERKLECVWLATGHPGRPAERASVRAETSRCEPGIHCRCDATHNTVARWHVNHPSSWVVHVINTGWRSVGMVHPLMSSNSQLLLAWHYHQWSAGYCSTDDKNLLFWLKEIRDKDSEKNTIVTRKWVFIDLYRPGLLVVKWVVVSDRTTPVNSLWLGNNDTQSWLCIVLIFGLQYQYLNWQNIN